jgi:hypothetical protein
MLLLRFLLTVALKAVLGAVVLGCIGASCFFAFEFGSGKAAAPELAMTYGLASGGLDLFKASLPLLAASALANRQWSRGTLTSLWCAFGTTAGQLAERFANQVVAKTAEHDKASKLERLRGQRAALGTFSRVGPEGVKAAQDAVDSAVSAKAQECGDVGRHCRERVADETARRAELAQAMRDQATTSKADELDAQIAAEEAIKIDVKTAEKDVDPQAASLAKATGVSEEKIALLSHVIFAIGIEIGSGLGLWLVFGHGGREPSHEAEKACVFRSRRGSPPSLLPGVRQGNDRQANKRGRNTCCL